MNNHSIFVLQDNVRLFDNGKAEFRLRRGIWNYDEAEIETSSYHETFQAFVRDMMDGLSSDQGFNISAISDSTLNADEKETINSLLLQLEAGNYIIDIANRDLNRELSYALLGYSLVDDSGDNSVGDVPEILVFTDSSHAKENALSLSSVMNMNLSFASDDDFKILQSCDLTTKTDGLTTEDTVSHFKDRYGKYRVYLVCLQHLSSKLMHNLNRLSLAYHIPMVISFVDGPMISVLSVKPYEAGCYECFEGRSLSRIQDHVLFHDFEKRSKTRFIEQNPCMIPVMNFLINISLAECYLFAFYGSSRFEGRLMSIFVPTLEIQVQDILRLPFCPACGMVAKEQLKEKNISTRSLIDNFVNNAILKKINKA